MKVKELFNETKTKLGIREAEQLITEILGKDRVYIYAHGEDEVEDIENIQKAIERRLNGEPLQYILKSASFMGIKMYVDDRVLIPRPETELLCEEAKRAVLLASAPVDPEKCRFCLQKGNCDSKDGRETISILDICTGSGAIAAYIAAEFPKAQITASDISSDALAVTEVNLRRIIGGEEAPELNPTFFGYSKILKLRNRFISLVQSDLFENISGQFDLITANPPYIPSETVLTLDPVVRDHEPHLALDGGKDGFELPMRLIKDSISHLKPDGTLLMEIGDDQGGKALEAAANSGFRSCRIIKDYAGQDRILAASL